MADVPYRQWCSVCAQAEGKRSPHRAIQDRKAVIQIDFACMSTNEQPGNAVTIFTGINVRTQMAMAVLAPSKSINRNGLAELNIFIYMTRRTQAILQCDDEYAIKVFRRAALRNIGGLPGRLAPTGSSPRQGSVE